MERAKRQASLIVLLGGFALSWHALAAPGAAPAAAPPPPASGVAPVATVPFAAGILAAGMQPPAAAPADPETGPVSQAAAPASPGPASQAAVPASPGPASQAAVPSSQPARTPRGRGLDRRAIGLLSPAACLAELDQAGVPYRRAPPRSGVVTPIRLTGPVGGVTYRGQGRSYDRTPFSILDCRLAVALVAFSDIVRERGITEVGYYSIHRPRNRGSRVKSGGRTGHRGGLAIDVDHLVTAEGREVNVYKDFKGRRRRAVCGPTAAPGATPEAQLLRDIVCESDAERLFHVLLTPNHDYAHRNHFHLEVRPDGARWFVMR